MDEKSPDFQPEGVFETSATKLTATQRTQLLKTLNETTRLQGKNFVADVENAITEYSLGKHPSKATPRSIQENLTRLETATRKLQATISQLDETSISLLRKYGRDGYTLHPTVETLDDGTIEVGKGTEVGDGFSIDEAFFAVNAIRLLTERALAEASQFPVKRARPPRKYERRLAAEVLKALYKLGNLQITKNLFAEVLICVFEFAGVPLKAGVAQSERDVSGYLDLLTSPPD